ncbi:Protein bric-a-brac 1 [Armadillidium nasatum]|uniref:Protein bric-a-brac 1 n=1 Tax=Armadillidium nasatum TaxID=96803 RepID=A0A5N5TDN2_9CRUS|nr:Protein bric-a-brac 1 [Armadillidium nasatum]
MDLVMGADQFLLTWNNHRSNFAEVFSQLRVQDQLVDVTLLCDGGSYPAHRLVLAACSPYFHQLFTKLPTQHPLVYLRDVRQAELEALLEFIYRGEVSVANSELTGLIKIAESLRIKGLGDVSQRDPAPSGRPEKRSATPFSNSSSPNSCGRARKAPRIATNESNTDIKNQEGTEYHSLIPPNPTSFAFRSPTFSHLIDNQAFSTNEGDQDSRDSTSPPFRESKLRSCLEGQDLPINLPLTNILAQSSGSSRLGGLLRKESERKKGLRLKGKHNIIENNDHDKDEKSQMVPFGAVGDMTGLHVVMD